MLLRYTVLPEPWPTLHGRDHALLANVHVAALPDVCARPSKTPLPMPNLELYPRLTPVQNPRSLTPTQDSPLAASVYGHLKYSVFYCTDGLQHVDHPRPRRGVIEWQLFLTRWHALHSLPQRMSCRHGRAGSLNSLPRTVLLEADS